LQEYITDKKNLQNVFMQEGERENWHKNNTKSRAATKEAYKLNKHQILMGESWVSWAYSFKARVPRALTPRTSNFVERIVHVIITIFIRHNTTN
jgi:hypothetical protein